MMRAMSGMLIMMWWTTSSRMMWGMILGVWRSSSMWRWTSGWWRTRGLMSTMMWRWMMWVRDIVVMMMVMVGGVECVVVRTGYAPHPLVLRPVPWVTHGLTHHCHTTSWSHHGRHAHQP